MSHLHHNERAKAAGLTMVFKLLQPHVVYQITLDVVRGLLPEIYLSQSFLCIVIFLAQVEQLFLFLSLNSKGAYRYWSILRSKIDSVKIKIKFRALTSLKWDLRRPVR